MVKENKYLQWLSQNTQSIYWHDSAWTEEVDTALANGAIGMTTNPFLINKGYQTDKSYWRGVFVKDIANSADIPEEITKEIVSYYSKKFMPLYKEGKFAQGYVCAQTDPNHVGDYEYMMAQAKRYAAIGENVVLKIPATKAGIRVIEECTALGYHTTATLSMTVSQVVAVAEARERGIAKAKANGIKPGLGIAVLMVGRLDNYIRDVAHDTLASATEEDIIHCGSAVFKRAYQIFVEKGYDTYLMPAGSFKANNITDIAGAKMIMSISPAIYDVLSEVDTFEENIDKSIPADMLERLMEIEEFRKAYELGGLTENQFVAFGGTNRTTAQYIECGWNLMKNL